jgi:hypothetical protein
MASEFQTSIFQRGFAPHPDLALTRKKLAKNLAAIHPLVAAVQVGVAKGKTCHGVG